eukprot:17689_1
MMSETKSKTIKGQQVGEEVCRKGPKNVIDDTNKDENSTTNGKIMDAASKNSVTNQGNEREKIDANTSTDEKIKAEDEGDSNGVRTKDLNKELDKATSVVKDIHKDTTKNGTTNGGNSVSIDSQVGDVKESEPINHNDANDGSRSDGSAEKGATSNSVGRRGDPRMHRAVAARLANPNMSLLDALIMGGFQFPNGTDGDGKSDRNVYDSDNVLLCQRKNQLSRRLRLAKRRSHETKADVESLVRLGHSKDPAAFLYDAQNLNQNDFYASSSSAEMQRNAALKRGYEGQSLDEHLAASRLKTGHEDDKTSFLRASGMPQASISALLQHQRGLGQTPAYFGANHYLPMHQQALGNTFLQNQVPLNFALNVSHPGSAGTQNAQNNIDRYLEMASSMAMGHQPVMFPQQNVAAAHGQLLNQSSLQNASTMSKPLSTLQNPQLVNNPPKGESAASPSGGEASSNGDKTGTQTQIQTSRKDKIERAVEVFEKERHFFVQRCLVMAGFEEHEIQTNKDIIADFEETLRKKV